MIVVQGCPREQLHVYTYFVSYEKWRVKATTETFIFPKDVFENISKTNRKMRSGSRRVEIMLEIGESCVKPIAEMDKDIWKVLLDYRMG